MTKEVSITIEGIQLGSEEAPIRMIASGVYHMHKDKHYIQYDEQSEDGQGSIKNMIKIGLTRIEMTKKGAGSSEMTFDLNQTTEVIYCTPYGTLVFEAKTSQITVEEKEEEIVVRLEYSLYTNEAPISDNRTTIRILPL
ncbi:MAG: hypothetical protein K0R46_1977 [Herbinix sp.]|jgi:uncharacterized beta-barrel protein YwiB (DUF1934 family)|nr:hypothetical protein [Herbinix sp.]